VWFDSHCHLHLCAENEPVDAVVERARAAGVMEMLTVGIDLVSSQTAVDIAAADGVRASVGVHPNSADAWNSAAESRVRELAGDSRVVAIGESGLDLYRDQVPLARQRDAFSAHIAIAKDMGKTLVIHTRESLDEAVDQLRSEGPPLGCIFHCWSGTDEQLDAVLDLGAFVSFAGNTSFKSAENLRSVARRVPADRLLVETDSPFLTPAPHRGKPNEPRHLPFVGVAVAQARGVPTKELAQQTVANARRAFALQA
jgi:TatD DNase family protein